MQDPRDAWRAERRAWRDQRRAMRFQRRAWRAQQRGWGYRRGLGSAAGGIFLIFLALAILLHGLFLPLLFAGLAFAALLGPLSSGRPDAAYGGLQGFIWMLGLALCFLLGFWPWIMLTIGASIVLGAMARPVMGGMGNWGMMGQPQQPYYQPPPNQPQQPEQPYYQPSSDQPSYQEQPYQPYQQGYQPPPQQPQETYQEGGKQYEYPPQYDQPQAQYPQEMPPQQ